MFGAVVGGFCGCLLWLYDSFGLFCIVILHCCCLVFGFCYLIGLVAVEVGGWYCWLFWVCVSFRSGWICGVWVGWVWVVFVACLLDCVIVLLSGFGGFEVGCFGWVGWVVGGLVVLCLVFV